MPRDEGAERAVLGGIYMNNKAIVDVKDLLDQQVSPELSDKLNEMLLGFNEDVQLEMVENMLSFICANVLHTTGCYSVDTALEMCYKWIGDEKGIATKGFGKLINRLI